MLMSRPSMPMQNLTQLLFSVTHQRPRWITSLRTPSLVRRKSHTIPGVQSLSKCPSHAGYAYDLLLSAVKTGTLKLTLCLCLVCPPLSNSREGGTHQRLNGRPAHCSTQGGRPSTKIKTSRNSTPRRIRRSCRSLVWCQVSPPSPLRLTPSLPCPLPLSPPLPASSLPIPHAHPPAPPSPTFERSATSMVKKGLTLSLSLFLSLSLLLVSPCLLTHVPTMSSSLSLTLPLSVSLFLFLSPCVLRDVRP